MSKVIQFEQEKRPVFCDQDFRDYVGYFIKDVISEGINSDVKIILENKQKERAEILVKDSALDGESIFITDRRNRDERD